MWKLIWSAILGSGPSGWLTLGLGVMLLLGGAFGAGYVAGAQGTVATVTKAQGAAPSIAAGEQKKADDRDRERGAQAGKAKDTRDAALDVKLSRLEAAIAALNKGPAVCPVSKGSIDILNEAGAQ